MNVAARLAATAGPGEAIVREAACNDAGLTFADLEARELELKGKSEPVSARVITRGVHVTS